MIGRCWGHTLSHWPQAIQSEALPLLLISLIVGLILAIFTAATQINEQTLTFVPKLLAILTVLALLGSTILAKLQDFTRMIFSIIANGG